MEDSQIPTPTPPEENASSADRRLLIGLILGVILVGVIAGIIVAATTRTADRSDTTSGTYENDEDAPPVTQNGDAPLYITTMTHMEGAFKEDQNENRFLSEVESIRWAMDLFDEYGAKLTIESETPFATANSKWGLNIMEEIVARGHGVGSHADFGYSPNGRDPLSLDELIAETKALKSLIDSVVGAENNLGLSGGIGQADWVIAAAEAGYKYKDGVTGIAYLSMPESERADGWTDEYIYQEGYHEAIPPEFAERIYPLPLKDATDLEPDEDWRIIVLGGEMGELASLDEGRVNCFPSCSYTTADNEVFLNAIAEAIRIRERDRVAHLNIHIPVKLLTEANEDTLRDLLAGIQEYINQDQAVWATQLASYQGYLKWTE